MLCVTVWILFLMPKNAVKVVADTFQTPSVEWLMHQWENTEKMQGLHKIQCICGYRWVMSSLTFSWICLAARGKLARKRFLQKMDKDNHPAMPSLDNRQARYVGSIKNAKFAKTFSKYGIKMCQTELSPQASRDCEYAVMSGRPENYLDNFGPWQHYSPPWITMLRAV